MFAGNYRFDAPAGAIWSKMVYVDLVPQASFEEVMQGANDEFELALSKNEQWLDQLARASSENVRSAIKKALFQDFCQYLGFPADASSYEQQYRENQKQTINDALDVMCTLDESSLRKTMLSGATVVGQASRMLVAQAYIDGGEAMAIVITPLEQLQDLILAQGFEADYDDIENDWARWQYESGRAINQTLKSVKKAIRKGALYAELEDVFSNTLSVLHLAGLASDMSFRSSALTSSHYACSEPYLLNQQRLERKNARHKQNALGNTH